MIRPDLLFLSVLCLIAGLSVFSAKSHAAQTIIYHDSGAATCADYDPGTDSCGAGSFQNVATLEEIAGVAGQGITINIVGTTKPTTWGGDVISLTGNQCNGTEALPLIIQGEGYDGTFGSSSAHVRADRADATTYTWTYAYDAVLDESYFTPTSKWKVYRAPAPGFQGQYYERDARNCPPGVETDPTNSPVRCRDYGYGKVDSTKITSVNDKFFRPGASYRANINTVGQRPTPTAGGTHVYMLTTSGADPSTLPALVQATDDTRFMRMNNCSWVIVQGIKLDYFYSLFDSDNAPNTHLIHLDMGNSGGQYYVTNLRGGSHSAIIFENDFHNAAAGYMTHRGNPIQLTNGIDDAVWAGNNLWIAGAHGGIGGDGGGTHDRNVTVNNVTLLGGGKPYAFRRCINCFYQANIDGDLIQPNGLPHANPTVWDGNNVVPGEKESHISAELNGTGALVLSHLTFGGGSSVAISSRVNPSNTHHDNWITQNLTTYKSFSGDPTGIGGVQSQGCFWFLESVDGLETVKSGRSINQACIDTEVYFSANKGTISRYLRLNNVSLGTDKILFENAFFKGSDESEFFSPSQASVAAWDASHANISGSQVTTSPVDVIRYVPGGPYAEQDFRLAPGAPPIDQGAWCAKAVGSGSASTTLIVDDIRCFPNVDEYPYFHWASTSLNKLYTGEHDCADAGNDGLYPEGEMPCLPYMSFNGGTGLWEKSEATKRAFIQLGSTRTTFTARADTGPTAADGKIQGTITLSSPATWSNNDGVNALIVEGAAPDAWWAEHFVASAHGVTAVNDTGNGSTSQTQSFNVVQNDFGVGDGDCTTGAGCGIKAASVTIDSGPASSAIINVGNDDLIDVTFTATAGTVVISYTLEHTTNTAYTDTATLTITTTDPAGAGQVVAIETCSTPVDVTPGSGATWTDFTVTGCNPGEQTLYGLEVINDTTSEAYGGRANGSATAAEVSVFSGGGADKWVVSDSVGDIETYQATTGGDMKVKWRLNDDDCVFLDPPTANAITTGTNQNQDQSAKAWSAAQVIFASIPAAESGNNFAFGIPGSSLETAAEVRGQGFLIPLHGQAFETSGTVASLDVHGYCTDGWVLPDPWESFTAAVANTPELVTPTTQCDGADCAGVSVYTSHRQTTRTSDVETATGDLVKKVGNRSFRNSIVALDGNGDFAIEANVTADVVFFATAFYKPGSAGESTPVILSEDFAGTAFLHGTSPETQPVSAWVAPSTVANASGYLALAAGKFATIATGAGVEQIDFDVSNVGGRLWVKTGHDGAGSVNPDTDSSVATRGLRLVLDWAGGSISLASRNGGVHTVLGSAAFPFVATSQYFVRVTVETPQPRLPTGDTISVYVSTSAIATTDTPALVLTYNGTTPLHSGILSFAAVNAEQRIGPLTVRSSETVCTLAPATPTLGSSVAGNDVTITISAAADNCTNTIGGVRTRVVKVDGTAIATLDENAVSHQFTQADGTYQVTVQDCNATGACTASANEEIVTTTPNAAPTADASCAITVTAGFDLPAPISISDLVAACNASGSGASLWVGAITQPADGTATKRGNDPAVDYQADQGFTGADSFTATFVDETGAESTPASTINVTVQDPPYVSRTFRSLERNLAGVDVSMFVLAHCPSSAMAAGHGNDTPEIVSAGAVNLTSVACADSGATYSCGTGKLFIEDPSISVGDCVLMGVFDPDVVAADGLHPTSLRETTVQQ